MSPKSSFAFLSRKIECKQLSHGSVFTYVSPTTIFVPKCSYDDTLQNSHELLGVGQKYLAREYSFVENLAWLKAGLMHKAPPIFLRVGDCVVIFCGGRSRAIWHLCYVGTVWWRDLNRGSLSVVRQISYFRSGITGL